ncbi:MAG: cupin domain-containing protein [Actinomycetota bacterium]|nr:cupin domain-containing protein [Actinomycetota bacterium]
MTNSAKTSTTHYEVQKKRRAQFIEEWRNNRRTVVHGVDVEIHETPRRISTGVYLGKDGDSPIRTVDAAVHQVTSGVVSTIHRHSWDAVMLCVGGFAWTEIDGKRISWGPGDSLYLPAWSWHRHGNDGDISARYMSFSSEPLIDVLGFGILEDGGDSPVAELPGHPGFAASMPGNDIYARRIRRLAADQIERFNGRLHTSWDELEFLQSPRGTRTTFLLDRAVGYRTSGLTMAMFEIGPGRAQSMHRHSGEAWLYVVEGQGHSFMGPEPDQGEDYEWGKGDLIVVDHYSWHQHFNDDMEKTARVVRVHILDTLLNTMNALCYPLNLLEEPPDHIRSQQTGDLKTIAWPEVERPSWP